MKKLLALFLAISMTFSLIIMPVSAADKLTVSLDQAEVEAGKEVKVNLNVSNNPGLTALTVRVFYKKDELTCTGISTQKQSDNNFTAWKQFEKELATLEEEEEQGRKVSVEFNKNDTSAANLSEERKNAGWALANFAYIVSKTVFDKNGVVACLTFKAAEGLESGTTPIEIEIVKASGEKNVTLETASLNSSLTINGVAPTLGKVTLSSTPVQVDGTTGATVNATATSTSNKDITGLVTWSISGDENSGVSINAATGVITVDAKAKAKADHYIVTATAIDGKTQGESKTATLKVTRAASIYTIRFEQNEKQTSIPASGSGTVNFRATGVDQYGQTTSSFSWSIEPAVKGVTVSGGVVTVTAEAAQYITDRQEFTVTASAGVGSSGTAKLVVYRDTAPARIEVSGAGTIAVPTTGEKKETYTATVKDQYGAEIEKPGTITWELTNDDGSAVVTRVGVTIENGVLTVTNAAAGNPFNGSEQDTTLRRPIYIKATCGNVSSRVDTIILTREKATVTTLKITGPDTLVVPTKSEYPNGQITPYPVTIYDQYGVEMNSDDYSFGRELETTGVSDVIFQPDGVKVTCYAAENQFDQNNALTFTIKASCVGKEATKTITLKREPSVATAITYHDTETTVVPTNEDQVPTNATPAVEDQYGLLMNNAKVEPDGELPTGIVLKNGELYITKAAVAHFGGERKDEVQVFVNLKCAPAENTAKLKLKLAAAQINKDSAEITGPASIAKPTGEQPNTAVYSISDVIKDQYGLPMEIDRSKLSLKLYHDKECGSEANGSGDPVQLSGPNQSGQWTVTVTKDATLDKTYYLKASYQVGNDSHMQCAPVKEITIVNKTVSNTLTVTQGDFTYGEEGKLNPVVKKGSEMITNATFVYTKGGQTVTEVKDAGKYTVTATCEDANYIYTGSVDFQILPKKIEVGWIDLDGTRYTYNGQQQTVQYTVKDGNTTLVKDKDYTVKDNSDSGTDAGVYRLEITGKGNYTSDPTGAPSVNWNIWEATLTVTGADIPAINYDPDFDGALTVNSVTFSGLMSGETLAKGTDYTVAATVGNRNAGTHQVVLTVRLLNENYKFEQGSGVVISDNANITVTINKIDHRAETVSAGCKYGNQLAMDLAQYLEGGSAAVGTITDNENILDAVEGGAKAIVQNGKLWLQLTNDSNKVGKDATVTLTVESTNYNPFTITVTVTVQGKETQTITASDLNVTYGDAGVKLNASALDNAELAYEVTEGTDVVTVDANGNVTLLKSGTAKIQITAAETEDYGTANTTVTVTVAKRSLTVKANDLTAYVGGQLPALDYTVTGLVSGDTLTTVPELELKDVPAGVDPMKTAGTYTIGFKTAPEADKDKYDLTVETGTLTVSSRPNVNPVPAGNSVKLEEAAGGKLTSSVSRATKGTTVTITVKPDAGYQLEELEVLDKNGEALPLKELANGKFSFQMPDSKVTVQASFVQESTYAGYPDVLPQDWFYSSVRYVTERGLMNGTPNGFEPNMDSSRATIWTILARFSGVDTTVVSGEWYAVARQWAMENGVSDGTNPNGVITREQLATMLYRFAKNKGLVQEPVTADLSVFVDAGQISDYALDAMRWAVSVGLLNGMDGSRLAPQGSAARAQVAAMLMRFDQLAK